MTDETPKKVDEIHIIKWTLDKTIWYLNAWSDDNNPATFRWSRKHNNAKRFASGDLALSFATSRLGTRKDVDIEVVAPYYADMFGYG